MKVKPKGILRNNDANTLTVEQAAAIICNARLQGSDFKFVGLKVKLDSSYEFSSSDFTNFYWHSRIGEDYIIAVDETSKTICIQSLNAGNGSTAGIRTFLLNYEYANDSRGFIYSGDFIGISHLNDIIILDTTEGKYYFYWDENADLSGNGRGNFVWLNELPIPTLMVQRDNDSSPLNITGVRNSTALTIHPTTTILTDYEDGLDIYRQQCIDEFIAHWDVKLQEGLKNDIARGAFYVRCAFKMYDGTYIYPSNPILCSNYMDGYNSQTDEYLKYFHLNIGIIKTINSEGDYIVDYNLETQIESLPGEYTEVIVKDTYQSLLERNHNRNYWERKYYDAYKYKWGIKIPPQTLAIIQKWYELGLIISVDLFITKPKEFLDFSSCRKWSSGNWMVGSTYTLQEWKPYMSIIPFNKNIIDMDLANEIFYKVDSITNFKENESVSVERTNQYWGIQKYEAPYITFKNAINIETNETLPTNNTYIVPKSSNTKLYNSIVHLIGVDNYFKDIPIDLRQRTTLTGVTDCQLHFLFSDGSRERWISIPSTYGVSVDGTIINFSIFNNILYFADARMKKVNITFLTSAGRRVFKSFDLKQAVTQNMAYKDHIRESLIYYTESSLSDQVRGMKPSYKFNYADFEIDSSGLVYANLPSIDYTISEYYDDKNRLQLSTTDNPFIYPANRSFRFGDISNKLIGCETSSLELQDYNFGKYPMYAITEQGIFVLEVGNADVAYSSQHLFKQINCIDNKDAILNCKGFVTFLSDDGINIISNGRIINVTQQLEGNNILKTEPPYQLLDSSARLTEVNTPFKSAKDYFFNDAKIAYDSLNNEIIFINSAFTIQFVLNLNNMSFSIRTDKVETRRNYSKAIKVNNRSVLCSIENGEWAFYSTEEYEKIPNVDGQGNMLIVSTVMPAETYVRIEHMITRFELSPISFSNSDVARYTLYAFILGSKDGVNWKTIQGGRVSNVEKQMNSIEIRRAFADIRYFQLVFYATYQDINSVTINQVIQELFTIENDVLLTNSFSEFDLEIEKKQNTKLR